MQLRQALKAHIASELEKEKQTKISANKEAVADILAQEFPRQIPFLASVMPESKDQVIQQVAQRHSHIRAGLEALKAQKAGGRTVGREIQADFAGIAGLVGKYAVSPLDKKVEAPSTDIFWPVSRAV